jgi:hypothetical protein
MAGRGPLPTVVEIPEVGHAPMLLCAEQIEPVARFLRATTDPAGIAYNRRRIWP